MCSSLMCAQECAPRFFFFFPSAGSFKCEYLSFVHGLRIIRLAIEQGFFVASAIFVYCNDGGGCESAGVSGQEIFFLFPWLLWSVKPPKLPGFVSLPHCRMSPGVVLSQSNRGIGAGAGPSSFFGDHRVLLQRKMRVQ